MDEDEEEGHAIPGEEPLGDHSPGSAGEAETDSAKESEAREEDPWGMLLEKLSLVDKAEPNLRKKMLFAKEGGQRAGDVHHMEGSVKATCKRHSKCCLWVNVRKSPERYSEAQAACATWLQEGLQCSAEDHCKSSRNIKLGFGMKVRA